MVKDDSLAYPLDVVVVRTVIFEDDIVSLVILRENIEIFEFIRGRLESCEFFKTILS